MKAKLWEIVVLYYLPGEGAGYVDANASPIGSGHYRACLAEAMRLNRTVAPWATKVVTTKYDVRLARRRG